jgi:SnoaL-like protein
MLQGNVERFRQFNQAFRSGDWDAVAASIDQHILIRTDPIWPEQRIYGHEAAMAFYRGAWESWGPDNRVEEIVDLGDRLLARNCWTIRGRHSGVEGDQWFSSISTYREGHVVFVEFFLDHEQALEALEMRG